MSLGPTGNNILYLSIPSSLWIFSSRLGLNFINESWPTNNRKSEQKQKSKQQQQQQQSYVPNISDNTSYCER